MIAAGRRSSEERSNLSLAPPEEGNGNSWAKEDRRFESRSFDRDG